MGRAGSRVV